MDIDNDIYCVIDYLELGGYHDHVLLLKGVDPLVYQRLVGAQLILFTCHDVFLMLVPQELVCH